MINYAARITQKRKKFYVSFRDFYGGKPVASGATQEEALAATREWLFSEASLALDSAQKLPDPTSPQDGEVLVEMPVTAQVKLLLLYELIDQNMTAADLARRMGVPRSSVQNIIRADHATKIDTLDKALRALGKRINIELLPLE
jgi:antitoxin HicB